MTANSFHSPTPFEELRQLQWITYASQNIRSVTRKIDDIKLLLNQSKVDVLFLNETWLNHSIGDPELFVEGYTAHRFDRDAGSGKRGGGGLLAYTRNHYTFTHKVEWNVCTPDLEIQWLILELPRTRPTYLANVYKPPDGNTEHALNLIESKILDTHGERSGDIVIMGDLNIDMRDSNSPQTRKYTLSKNCKSHATNNICNQSLQHKTKFNRSCPDKQGRTLLSAWDYRLWLKRPCHDLSS